ncbi:MAG TPA: hypothetical protein VFM56_12800 [Solimonas sp.]|nr:hypothetical protein [Solimonas sp.]
MHGELSRRGDGCVNPRDSLAGDLYAMPVRACLMGERRCRRFWRGSRLPTGAPERSRMRSALAALSADGDSGERLSRTAFDGIARLRCRRSATLFASHPVRKSVRGRTQSGKSLFARRLRGDGMAIAAAPVDDRDFHDAIAGCRLAGTCPCMH